MRLLHILPSSTPEHIHCVLFQPPRDQATKYTAISYYWDSKNTTKEILLDGTIVSITTTNLWLALSSIVEYDTTPVSDIVWIDALCIEKSDVHECNHRVHRLWQSSSCARMFFRRLGGLVRQRVLRGRHQASEINTDPHTPNASRFAPRPVKKACIRL